MIFLVPEINLLNFILFFILSFVVKIQSYKVPSFLVKWKGKIEIIDLSNYFTWEECEVTKSESVEILERLFSNFSLNGWNVKIRGRCIDLSIKAKQDLGKDVEKLLFFKKIIDRNKTDRVYIVNSLKIDFLLKLDLNGDFLALPEIKMLSSLNKLIDRLNYHIFVDLYLLGRITIKFIQGIIFNKDFKRKVRFIYDGVSPRELSFNNSKITFAWLIDNKYIDKDDILFILPKSDFQMRQDAYDCNKYDDLLAVNNFKLNILAHRSRIFSILAEIIMLFFRNRFLFLPTLKNLMLAEYSLYILEWLPLVESIAPKVYINTSSNIGTERSIITYFNTLGIETITWFYGTNSYLFTKFNSDCRFRNIVFCNIISSRLIVWNRHFKEFIQEHPQQNKLKIEIMGPLMAGEEEVMNLSKEKIFNKYMLSYSTNFKYISIFDSPPLSFEHRGNTAWCPDSNSEEYNYLFIRDIFNLINEFDNICLIYKPKRSLISGKFSYSIITKKIIEQMKENERVIILDYNINPWVPIALADLCISLPFESPTVAVWHYGKPGLFHDPMNIALSHRYKTLSCLITHNYDELKSKVYYWLFENNRIGDLSNNDIRYYQGAHPARNSSDMFRRYLNSLTN
jgi:polysaccharide biosynthesis PFTS motif protein